MWYAHSGPRSKDTGKFRTRKPVGTAKQAGERYRGWSYDFISHQTGASVRRTSYSVSITDPYGNRVEYLRDFSSVESAGAAARKWIDDLLSKMMPAPTGEGVGTIPAVPTEQVPQEK